MSKNPDPNSFGYECMVIIIRIRSRSQGKFVSMHWYAVHMLKIVE